MSATDSPAPDPGPSPGPAPGRRVSWRVKAARHPVTKTVLHPAITLGSLLILFALVFFGTLYQTDHGLHVAQEAYFSYGWVLVYGWFPLPGANVVLWILSIQLVAMIAFILPWKVNRIGLWISHLGILALMVGGFITDRMAVESQLTLVEGETGHFTTSYHEHEVAFWESTGDTNRVFAYEAEDLKRGRILDVAPYNVRVRVNAYYPNSAAFSAQAASDKARFISASDIGFLERRKPEKEVTQNMPGLLLTLMEPGRPDREVLLFAGEIQPLILTLGDKKVFVQLRHKHYPLDFSLKLTEFVKEVHPGTEIPSNFESYAELNDGRSTRNVKVWMNNPLRYAGYTFFQASYAQAANAPEQSTFAVVTNPGRLLPYISSLVVFGGILLHFLMRLAAFRRKEST